MGNFDENACRGIFDSQKKYSAEIKADFKLNKILLVSSFYVDFTIDKIL